MAGAGPRARQRRCRVRVPPRVPTPRRPRLVAAAIALVVGPGAAWAADGLNVLTWGGDFTAAQQVAFATPFAEATGIGVNLIDADNPTTVVKAQVTAGNVTTDVASVAQADALRLCEEGLALPIDAAILAPAPDGTQMSRDFLPGGLGECFVATDVYSTVIGYDTDAIGVPPTSIADFFDLQKYPGRRGVLREPRLTLEMALMGDGVPPDRIYDMLATPEGLDRAFAKLDSIRDQIVWWEAGAQPVQMLVDGEVAMTMAYNGRLFAAAVDQAKPVGILWDGQVYETEGWMIPKGAPHLDAALKFVAFTTAPEPLARMAEQLSYGPSRESARALLGRYKDGQTDLAPYLPTAPANLRNALAVGVEFWADHDAELSERFAAFVAR